jgi:hypothetical protein
MADAFVSKDKQYEYVTGQVARATEWSRQAFRHYVQVYSALVGGAIWLSMDTRITGSLRETYPWLSNGAVSLLAFVAIALVFDALRSWRANRFAQVHLGRPNEIPPPRMIFSTPKWGWSGMVELAIGIAIAASCAFFWWQNPFGVPLPTAVPGH